MNWLDVLMIVFSATAANHLGLVAAAESIVRHRLPVLNCPKCAAFWLVLSTAVALQNRHFHPNPSFEIPLPPPSSPLGQAIWLDLLMGIIDQLYTKLYDKIYPTTDTIDADALDTADPVSDVSE